MNWYKESQALEEIETPTEERLNLPSITHQQWQEINNTSGGINRDHKSVLDEVVNGKEYLKKYSPQKVSGTFQKAIKYFGITNSLRECGYILPNGTMLDLSGKNQGGSGGTRALDHREINDIISMPDFISMGAIRHFPEQPGVDIRKNPTQQQLDIIYRDVESSGNGYTLEILDSRRGRFYTAYDIGVKASKVINDIKNFYYKLSFNLSFYESAKSNLEIL
jgi:hypothetical protein